MSNIFAGVHCRDVGEYFEQFFESICRIKSITCTVFPNGCERFGGQLRQIETPFDFIMTSKGQAAFLDTKTGEGHFPYSKLKSHQIHGMLKHENDGHRAGYVIWNRKADVIFFMPASRLVYMIGKRNGSVKHTDEGALILGNFATFMPEKLFLGCV